MKDTERDVEPENERENLHGVGQEPRLFGRRHGWSVGRRLREPDSYGLLLGLIALLLVAATARGEWADLDVARVSLRSGVAVAYLAVFGSIVAFSCYVWMLRVSTPAKVATYAYVNPVVAVVLGALVLAEPITAPPSARPGKRYRNSRIQRLDIASLLLGPQRCQQRRTQGQHHGDNTTGDSCSQHQNEERRCHHQQAEGGPRVQAPRPPRTRSAAGARRHRRRLRPRT